ncbi:hypothetical protein DV738_g4755, partial [Chaetothyriales sp. CBS 135597]
MVDESTWLKVLARGRIDAGALLATEFFLTRAALTPATLSLREFLGRDEGVVEEWSFCWCLSSKSRLAKHLVHSEQENGFSLVWDLNSTATAGSASIPVCMEGASNPGEATSSGEAVARPP